MDRSLDQCPPEWKTQTVTSIEEGTDTYLVVAIANFHFGSSTDFLVGIQHICNYGKTVR